MKRVCENQAFTCTANKTRGGVLAGSQRSERVYTDSYNEHR
eukprot:CAMPEP_0202392502 /NCGR_PEP_ID=MMETSP1127-20130417/92408_1 /ASSEMBLY_ACC=CAM_ASM_000462 /TAXON_ID=3047 /ORGANISM="Dunaliella tertiolecta, Strain CCMP1320" /LENGTH=40 /DNA_ID= /DNA_START= /DNA_END= /DNA_ORIENTATION=